MFFFPVTVVRKHFPVSLQGHKTFPVLTSVFDQQNLASRQLSLSSEEPEPIFITLMEVQGGLEQNQQWWLFLERSTLGKNRLFLFIYVAHMTT